MQDTADTETGDDGSETSSLDSRRLLSGDKRPSHTGESGSMPVEVKKHQHKHNLKHRYEVLETLGKGTYGKVKRAVERTTRKTVGVFVCFSINYVSVYLNPILSFLSMC